MTLQTFEPQPTQSSMARRLQGRTALVTGSTSGIGLGVAKALAAEGADIVLNGLGLPSAIEATRATLADAHAVRVEHSAADLSDPGAVREMMTFARDKLGPVDILVNNAGIQFVSPVEEFPEAKWDAILAINLSSSFHAIKAALPDMKSRGWGRIINVASAHGLVASPFKSAYVAAKHGLVGLTKTVALEAATAGVTCNAICPGYVWTPLVEKQIEDQAHAHKISREAVINDVLLAAQPNKQFATVEQIGALVVFLCGNAGDCITGSALSVDGGWTAH
jgi:3-hydroxybutyrate dehydrogenase